MKAMTFQEWAKAKQACTEGVAYLRGKRPDWKTWIQAGGDWRHYVCQELNVDWCSLDIGTLRPGVCVNPECSQCRRRALLNKPRRYAALKKHWETIVLPALQKAGVR